MNSELTIALDVMGGDLGASIVIPGAELAAIRHPTYRFLLFGDRAIIAPLLEQHPKLKAKAEIRHTDVAVGMVCGLGAKGYELALHYALELPALRNSD